MKISKLLISIIIAVFVFHAELFSTDNYCQNLGFELGNFTNWQGYTWYNSTISSVTTTLPAAGFGLQSIMSDTTAYDSNTNYKLKKIPQGFKYSARLGDLISNTQAASLRYTLTVDSSNAFLLYRFAVVFLNPLSGHTKLEEPRFKVSLFDQNGDTIPSCANYDVYTSQASLSGSFNSYTPSGSNEPVLWRDWTAVGVNLLPYIGQTVSIEFMASDCTHKGHYGYAYIAAECRALRIIIKYCSGDAAATLEAPEGFTSYSWVNSQGQVVGTSQELSVSSPVEGDVYTCSLTSATGCQVSLSATINRYEPNADFQNETIDCNNLTNTVKFYDPYQPIHGTYEYQWNFDDGTSSGEQNPVHTFTTSGVHTVSLVVTNPPSTCSDSVSKNVETFYPPLIKIAGDSTYCDGSSVTLKGVGAYRYLWSNGSTEDSISIDKDTIVWMIGYSSEGCYTKKLYKAITKEPDWNFSVEGNSFFCKDSYTVLKAVGADYCVWNDTLVSDSIIITHPGNIKIAGFNSRGCEIDKYVNVIEVIPPDASFTYSPSVLNKKHNTISCVILYPQTDAVYNWTFYEESGEKYEIGSIVNHSYTDFNVSGEYPITSYAVDSYGCSSVSENKILAEPFFPNVFTPNNDGYNELFLKGYQLKIFDRYGILIYNGDAGWDGTYRGKAVSQDTYFYVTEYLDFKNITHVIKGSITLIR
jgi:gliding motility-associated-like protein